MATESEVMTALLGMVNVGRSERKKATEPSSVALPRPVEQTTITLVERAGGTSRSGRRSIRGWQAYIFAASAYGEDNARESLEDANEALVNKVLVVGDERSTPIALGPSRPVGPDDGSFSGSKSYLFTI